MLRINKKRGVSEEFFEDSLYKEESEKKEEEESIAM